MLTLYYQETTGFTSRIKQKLEEMVIAHKAVKWEEGASLPDGIVLKDLPVLTDGHQLWSTPEGIEQQLEELHRDMILSHQMQSDTCHLDPDNPGECL